MNEYFDSDFMSQLWSQLTQVEEFTMQGDHSGCAKPPVDIKTKVPIQNEELILKRNICFGVNRRFVTT